MKSFNFNNTFAEYFDAGDYNERYYLFGDKAPQDAPGTFFDIGAVDQKNNLEKDAQWLLDCYPEDYDNIEEAEEVIIDNWYCEYSSRDYFKDLISNNKFDIKDIEMKLICIYLIEQDDVQNIIDYYFDNIVYAESNADIIKEILSLTNFIIKNINLNYLSDSKLDKIGEELAEIYSKNWYSNYDAEPYDDFINKWEQITFNNRKIFSKKELEKTLTSKSKNYKEKKGGKI